MKITKHKKNQRYEFFTGKTVIPSPIGISQNRIRYKLSYPSHGDKEMNTTQK